MTEKERLECFLCAVEDLCHTYGIKVEDGGYNPEGTTPRVCREGERPGVSVRGWYPESE